MQTPGILFTVSLIRHCAVWWEFHKAIGFVYVVWFRPDGSLDCVYLVCVRSDGPSTWQLQCTEFRQFERILRFYVPQIALVFFEWIIYYNIGQQLPRIHVKNLLNSFDKWIWLVPWNKMSRIEHLSGMGNSLISRCTNKYHWELMKWKSSTFFQSTFDHAWNLRQSCRPLPG